MARKNVRLETTYLYPDNHAICIFEEHHATSGSTVKWAEVFERFIESGHLEMPQEGRIILSRSLANLVRKARHVKVWKDNSSTATKNAGYIVQTLAVSTKDGEFDVTYIEGLMHGDFQYQATARDGTSLSRTFAEDVEANRWGWNDLNIAKVHRLEKEAVSHDETASVAS